MNTAHRLIWLAVLAILTGCAQQPPAAPPDTRSADEAAIRAAVSEWSSAAQAKDAARFASFYADDAVLMMEGTADVRGKEAITKAATGMMQDPNFALSFQADRIVVARSGDIAYETGSYSLTMSDPAKNPATQRGNYVVVWQKQGDGTWKAAIDAPVSEPAAAPAAQ